MESKKVESRIRSVKNTFTKTYETPTRVKGARWVSRGKVMEAIWKKK